MKVEAIRWKIFGAWQSTPVDVMHRSACDGWVSLSFAPMLCFLNFEIWQAENFFARCELNAREFRYLLVFGCHESNPQKPSLQILPEYQLLIRPKEHSPSPVETSAAA